MGSGNIDVGNKTPTRKPELRIDNPNPPKAERAEVCGAMSQQNGHHGNESAPQEFVRLVGCRDPKAGHEPWVRPSSVPVKR